MLNPRGHTCEKSAGALPNGDAFGHPCYVISSTWHRYKLAQTVLNYIVMTRSEHRNRPRRESISKRIGARKARRIRARDDHRCVYCGDTAEASGSHLHLDHLTPQSHGGADEVGNLVLACRRCNSARQNMTLAQWAAYAREKYGLEFTWQQIRGQARRAA